MHPSPAVQLSGVDHICEMQRDAHDLLTVLCTFCCRDYTAADVLTTANALQRSKLQTLSVACGRVRVPRAYANVTLSVTGCDDNSTECQQAAQLADQGNAFSAPDMPLRLCCS